MKGSSRIAMLQDDLLALRITVAFDARTAKSADDQAQHQCLIKIAWERRRSTPRHNRFGVFSGMPLFWVPLVPSLVSSFWPSLVWGRIGMARLAWVGSMANFGGSLLQRVPDS
jgi:hypothetical protein